MTRPQPVTVQAGHDAEAEWPFGVCEENFQRELRPALDRLTVSAYRFVRHVDKTETVRVTSALVTPGTAPALLRALQTSPDTRRYRIPDTTDSDYSSTVEGFEMLGWLEPDGQSEGLDAKDPFASGVHFPPLRPATAIAGLDDLLPDLDMRLWFDADRGVAFESRVWGEPDADTSSQSSSGFELLADTRSLGSRLRSLNRWLIVEVEIERDLDSRIRGAYRTARDDDEALAHLQPHTRYFLLDFTGSPRDL